MAVLSKRSLDNLKQIHPDLVLVMTEAIKTTPIDFTITDGIRTTAEQQRLYAQGRTTPGKIVTNTDGVRKKSNHQPHTDGYGYAVDLYPYRYGSVQVNDANGLKIIAEHIKLIANALGVKIQWGGDWLSLIDMPHFELVK